MAVDKTLRVWDAASGKCLRVLEGHTEPVYSCEFSPDARAIVSGSGDKTLRVWDAATGKRRRVLKGHVGWVLGCGFSPDGHLIVSASNDRTLRVWDPATGECCCIFAARTDMVHDCEFSPDGRLVLSGSGRGLAVWDVVNLGAPIVGRRPRLTTSNEPARVLEGHTEPVHSCGFSPDGRLIVSASSDETLRVWDVGTGECLRTLEGHSGPVSGCAVSPDGTWIVSASWDRTLRVWEAASGEQILVLPLLEDLRCIAVHPWLPLASCGGGGGGVYILDLVGLEFGPIVVTAARRSDGLTLTCPACQQEHPLTQGQLDTVLSCPAPTCGLSLRPNPFVLNGIAGVASNRPNT